MPVAPAIGLMLLAGVSAAGTAVSTLQARRDAAAQKRALADKERAARVAAREKGALDSTVGDSGAEFKLGRGGPVSSNASSSERQAGSTSLSGAVSQRVGGLGGIKKPRLSKGIGL